MNIPKREDIKSLGFVSEEEKYLALSSAELLIMPSFFESLSIILLEAWSVGCPSVANGQCDVLKGQTIRSNAGLYYENYSEFEHVVSIIIKDRDTRQLMSKKGSEFIKKYYNWHRVTKEYSDFIKFISKKSYSK
jgi:glycosyltransferase involved in cell wall biosynthesis